MSDIVITVIGNIVNEPQMHVTSSGATVVSFRLASTERKYDRNDNRWVDGSTSYTTVACWRQLATNVFASMHKGDPVVVNGRMRVREWEKDGKKGTAVEIEAQSVGPDLARGTAVFARTQRVREAGEESPWMDQVVQEAPASGEAETPAAA